MSLDVKNFICDTSVNFSITNKIVKKQDGVVLFMALIILVAMTLAGIAMVRSVDTGNIVAGNLAFRQSTTLAADAGIQAGYQWLRAGQAAGGLVNDLPTQGYFSNVVAAEPDWQAEATWANAQQVGPDAAGNTVQFLMHRLCTNANTAPARSEDPGLLNKCATNKAYASDISQTGAGNEGDPQGLNFVKDEAFLYRITSRVKGPRNTVSITQATVFFDK